MLAACSLAVGWFARQRLSWFTPLLLLVAGVVAVVAVEVAPVSPVSFSSSPHPMVSAHATIAMYFVMLIST